MNNLNRFKHLYCHIIAIFFIVASCAIGQGESMKSLFDGNKTLIENKNITNDYLIEISQLKGKKRKFLNCTFQSCRWKQADLDNIDFEHCIFKDSTFENSDFSDSNFIKTKFINCSFDTFTWYDGTFKQVTFKDSKLNDVTFDGVAGDHVSFTDSKVIFTFQGKKFNVLLVSNCDASFSVTGTTSNINITNLVKGSDFGFGGDLTNIMVESCEKLDGINLIEGKVTDLKVHNSNINRFDIEAATLNATNPDKPNTITNCSMQSLVIKDSKVNDLTLNHSSVNDYFVLQNTEFNRFHLKNVDFSKIKRSGDLGGVQYDGTSDHFPPATEKK